MLKYLLPTPISANFIGSLGAKQPSSQAAKQPSSQA